MNTFALPLLSNIRSLLLGALFWFALVSTTFVTADDHLRPYSDRRDVLTLTTPAAHQLDPRWTSLKRAYLETLVEMAALYPDHTVLIFGRGLEYMGDLVLRLRRHFPQFNRFKPVNVSRNSIDAALRGENPGLLPYLEQEAGLSEHALQSGEKFLLLDSGYHGTIQSALRNKFFPTFRKNIDILLIASEESNFPDSHLFWVNLEPRSVAWNSDSFAPVMIEYHETLLPRATTGALVHRQIDSRWQAMHDPNADLDMVDPAVADLFQEDLAYTADQPETITLIGARLTSWAHALRDPAEMKRLGHSAKVIDQAMARDYAKIKGVPLSNFLPVSAATVKAYELLIDDGYWAEGKKATFLAPLMNVSHLADIAAILDYQRDINAAKAIAQAIANIPEAMHREQFLELFYERNDQLLDKALVDFFLKEQSAAHGAFLTKLTRRILTRADQSEAIRRIASAVLRQPYHADKAMELFPLIVDGLINRPQQGKMGLSTLFSVLTFIPFQNWDVATRLAVGSYIIETSRRHPNADMLDAFTQFLYRVSLEDIPLMNLIYNAAFESGQSAFFVNSIAYHFNRMTDPGFKEIKAHAYRLASRLGVVGTPNSCQQALAAESLALTIKRMKELNMDTSQAEKPPQKRRRKRRNASGTT